MGKFDGVLLCSDLDDTLLDSEKRISKDNKDALERFMSEGGHFAYATGRVPMGAKLALSYIIPNSPIVCFNGAGIYDFRENKILWEKGLPKEASAVVEFVDAAMPQAGIEICTRESVYFSKMNRIVRRNQLIEHFPDNYVDYHDVADDWIKVIFMMEEEYIPKIKELIKNSEYADKYNFIRSSPHYYEMLPKGATKGDAMLELARQLGIDPKKTIGVGDNENDITLVTMSGIGVAVANAMPAVRSAADYITVDNNHSALAAVIEGLENGSMKFA